MTQHTIVAVGFDGSDGSEQALRFATEEVIRRGASLRIVCAYEMPALTYTTGVDLPVEVTRELAAAAERLVQEAATRIRAMTSDVTVEAVSAPGRASRVLIDHATDAELLIVGTRHLGGAGRLFHGSVSTELVHHSPVPVVVVPAPAVI